MDTVQKEDTPFNYFWAIAITRTNFLTVILSVLLFLGIDVFILITDPSLAGFWFMMWIPFILLIGFFYLENIKLRKRFLYTKSRIDILFLLLNIARNIVLFLNFIPLIQLLGIMLLMVGIVPYLIIYAILVYYRSKQ